MMSKKFVKVLCIILAALMLLSGVAVLTQVFAAAPGTGVEDVNPTYLIIGAALCLLIIILCIALPKFKKKSDTATPEEPATKGENEQ